MTEQSSLLTDVPEHRPRYLPGPRPRRDRRQHHAYFSRAPAGKAGRSRPPRHRGLCPVGGVEAILALSDPALLHRLPQPLPAGDHDAVAGTAPHDTREKLGLHDDSAEQSTEHALRTTQYACEPFAADVSEGQVNPILRRTLPLPYQGAAKSHGAGTSSALHRAGRYRSGRVLRQGDDRRGRATVRRPPGGCRFGLPR